MQILVKAQYILAALITASLLLLKIVALGIAIASPEAPEVRRAPIWNGSNAHVAPYMNSASTEIHTGSHVHLHARVQEYGG